MKKYLLAGLLSCSALYAQAQPELYFIEPTEGDTVSSPVTVKFGLKGFGIAPAGVPFNNTGHHHLIVDAPLPALDKPIPADKNHLHYGAGQTETQLDLAPGTHTLQLLLGDHLHTPHKDAIYSQPITITVK